MDGKVISILINFLINFFHSINDRFDPNYQPFTTDRNKHFSFMNQFNALKVNMKTFSESILYLILELKNDSNDEVHENINLKNIDYSQIIEDMITTEFDQILENEFDEMRLLIIFSLFFSSKKLIKYYIPDERN